MRTTFLNSIWKLCLLFGLLIVIPQLLQAGDGVRVGAAAVNLKANDHMPVAGGIHPGVAQGQEGELRAIAIVLEKEDVTLAIVTLDILMITRDVLDVAAKEIEDENGNPFC